MCVGAAGLRSKGVVIDMTDIHQFEPLWGAWRIEKELGEGGYGKVYKAVRKEFGATYYAAIKHISIPMNQTEVKNLYEEGLVEDEASARGYYERMLENILYEIRMMNALKGHTNIVAYEDHLVIEKRDMPGYDVFIRMELLRGLYEHMSSTEFTVLDVCKLGIDICTALEVLESKNIVHRDIKPANILYSDDGNYKLSDFGVARTLNNNATVMSKKGTYSYMAPEVYRGQPASFNSDIYSLGLVMYRLLNNNRAPFLPLDGSAVTYEQNEEALMRRMNGETIPYALNADQGMASLLSIACDFKPEYRFQTAAQFKAALLSYKEDIAPNRNTIVAQGKDASSEHMLPNSTQMTAQELKQKKAEIERQKKELKRQKRELAEAESERIEAERAAEERKQAEEAAAEAKRQADELWEGEKRRNANLKKIAKKASVISAAVLLAAFLVYATGWLLIPYIKYTNAVKILEAKAYDEAYNAFIDLGDFRDSADKAKDALYQKGNHLIDLEDYANAAILFERIPGYSSSNSKAAYCRNEAAYLEAKALMDKGEYKKAADIFTSVADHSDSNALANEAKYLYGLACLESEDYENAIEALKLVGDYKEASAKLPEAKYLFAGKLAKESDLEKSAALYKELGDYKDSDSLYKETYYNYGLDLLNKKTWKSAVVIFSNLDGYKESKDKLNAAKYGYVLANKNNNDRTTYGYLQDLEKANYKDSKKIYKSLYAWKVSIVMNDSETDETTNKTSISRHGKYYGHIKVSGGPPGESVMLKYTLVFPTGKPLYDSWDYPFRRGDTSWCYGYYESSNPPKGTFKIRVYNKVTRELLAEGSVKIK